jgi:hypothetical protein
MIGMTHKMSTNPTCALLLFHWSANYDSGINDMIGDGHKAMRFLNMLRSPRAFVAIDIAHEFLKACADKIKVVSYSVASLFIINQSSLVCVCIPPTIGGMSQCRIHSNRG